MIHLQDPIPFPLLLGSAAVVSRQRIVWLEARPPLGIVGVYVKAYWRCIIEKRLIPLRSGTRRKRWIALQRGIFYVLILGYLSITDNIEVLIIHLILLGVEIIIPHLIIVIIVKMRINPISILLLIHHIIVHPGVLLHSIIGLYIDLGIRPLVSHDLCLEWPKIILIWLTT